MKSLVTGGTDHLGRVVVEHLKTDGHRVRILARHPLDDSTVEWVRADLGHSSNLASAVEGVDAVIHAATHSPAAQRSSFRPLDFIRSPTTSTSTAPAPCSPRRRKRESSTRPRLHRRARAHGPDQTVLARQARAERLVRESAVPWSIVRAPRLLLAARADAGEDGEKPLLLLHAGVRMQPVDSDEFAVTVAAAVADGQRGERRDFAGPQTLTMRQLGELYVALSRARKSVTVVCRRAELNTRQR
jgi:uncharacterized protein YbjT (DUF2867 family)